MHIITAVEKTIDNRNEVVSEAHKLAQEHIQKGDVETAQKFLNLSAQIGKILDPLME